MGLDRQGSKSGGYVGGFLQMFDWNARSRKKLFSSKSDVLPESKQKKICDGNLPTTRLHMLDEDTMATGSSIKGSSDYSCASSVTDEDFCGTKSPGVVGRLMGLDSLPKSKITFYNSRPVFDTQSLPDVHSRPKNFNYFHDHQIMHSSSLHELSASNVVEPKYQNQKLIKKPIEKFQTEILPPKSAKPIPITQNKLLSPIKSANFIPPEDAAHIMEAAARIIEPGQKTPAKAKTVRSSSVPLRVQKEKVQGPSKPSKRSTASEKPGESSSTNVKRLPRTKSLSESMDSKSLRVYTDSEECSTSVKSTGKSISLALQAKANVQKREGLNVSGSRSLVSQNEQNEFTSYPSFKSQPSTQKSMVKKPSTHNGSSVFQQNNQKQNCLADRGKPPSVNFPFASNSRSDEKELGGDSFSAQKENSDKLAETYKVGSRRSSLQGKDDRAEASYSGSKRTPRKKQSTDGDCHSQKIQAAHNTSVNKNRKVTRSSASVDRPISWEKDNRRTTTDVVSFTFNAPMTRSVPGPQSSTESGDNCKGALVTMDNLNVSKFSFLGHNILQGDRLSTLLEQKLKELTHGVEFPQNREETASSSLNFQTLVPGMSDSIASTILHDSKANVIDKHNQLSQWGSSFSADPHGFKPMNEFQGVQDKMDNCGSVVAEFKIFDPCLPSPVSVLEQSPIAESCSSLETADSISTTGSRQCSSVQAREVLCMHSLKICVPAEVDSELSDSASSLQVTEYGKSTQWELIYVKEILSDIELMFKDYALGQACEIINPNLFDQVESRKGFLNDYDLMPRKDRRLLFDCLSECLELRCRQYVGGGCKTWVKGVSSIRRKERLAQEVCGEILGWSSMGDSMVDELVDKDMSSRYGRWLDFEIEAFELGTEIEDRVLNSLLDEVVADILVI